MQGGTPSEAAKVEMLREEMPVGGQVVVAISLEWSSRARWYLLLQKEMPVLLSRRGGGPQEETASVQTFGFRNHPHFGNEYPGWGSDLI